MPKWELIDHEPDQAVGLAHAHWEHFPHEADVGIRGVGPTKADAFAQAAVAMTAVVTDLGTIRIERTVPIVCWAPYDELLLVDWLNALIYEMTTRRMLFRDFVVKIDPDGRLQAEASGELLDEERHQPAAELKGAMLAELHVGQDADGLWSAQCIVDV